MMLKCYVDHSFNCCVFVEVDETIIMMLMLPIAYSFLRATVVIVYAIGLVLVLVCVAMPTLCLLFVVQRRYRAKLICWLLCTIHSRPLCWAASIMLAKVAGVHGAVLFDKVLTYPGNN